MTAVFKWLMHSSPIARGQLLLADFFSDNPIEESGSPHWFASEFL